MFLSIYIFEKNSVHSNSDIPFYGNLFRDKVKRFTISSLTSVRITLAQALSKSCKDIAAMFSDCTCFSSSKYKWLILAAGCVTMFLRAIFISGTLPVLSIYYNDKYTDRKLASMISSIQTATGFVGCKLYFLSDFGFI